MDPFALREDATGHLAAIGIGRPRLEPGPARPPGPTVLPALDLATAAPAGGRRGAGLALQLQQAEAVAALAALALQQVLSGQAPQADWMGHVPAPDGDDEDQQTLFANLVAALADWSQRHYVPGDDPLGPEPALEQDRPEWQHLTQGLELYQQSRIQDQLALIRARRSSDRARLDDVARETTERTNRRPRPGNRPPPARPSTPGDEGHSV